MNTLLHRCVLAAALTSLSAYAATPSQAPASEATAPAAVPESARLETALREALVDSRPPALGALVIRDGRVVAQAVSGVRRNDSAEPVRINGVWLIGSTGKPMTVALIARLVDRGVLSWTTPLDEMLPELAAGMRREYRKVTLVQLLSHTAGLPENLGDAKALDAFFVDTRPLQEQRLALSKAALAEAPAAAPGSAFGYSNSGFVIAAAIAERATGKRFEDLMRTEVFEPLSVASAGFGTVLDDALLGHRAGHPALEMRRSDDGVPPVYSAAGNVHMNLADWARFNLDQLAGARGRGALLKPASYTLMQTAQPGSPSGLDWGVQPSIAGRQGPVLVHGGSDGNWLAWVALFSGTQNGMLVIANAADDMGADVATRGVMGAWLPTLSPAK